MTDTTTPGWACLAQAPDLIDDTGKAHVCGMIAGHDYVAEDHTGTFWHHCGCGAAFTGDTREVTQPTPELANLRRQRAALLDLCDETDAEQATDGSDQPAVITTRRIRELLSEGEHRAG